MNSKYYTYAYLREDRTPYYIGKGKGNRAYKKRTGEIRPPKDENRIILLKQNLTEEEAFRHEKYMISVFGRKDLRTGILRNKTDGGEGASGSIKTEEHRKKLSVANKGKKLSEETKNKMSEKRKGRVLSEETKQKIRESLSGIKRSDETKKKISEVTKGRIPWNKGKSASKLPLDG